MNFKYFFFTIPSIILIISFTGITSVYGTAGVGNLPNPQAVQVPLFSDWKTISSLPGSYQTTIDLSHPRIMDTSGSFSADYYFFNNTNTYTIATGYGTYVYNTANCAIKLYPPVLDTTNNNPLINSITFTIKQSPIPKAYSNSPLGACSTSVSNANNVLQINGTRSNVNATLLISFKMIGGNQFKSSVYLIPKINNTYWQITESAASIPPRIKTQNATFIENYPTASNETTKDITGDVRNASKVFFVDALNNLISYNYQTSISFLNKTGISFDPILGKTNFFNDFRTPTPILTNHTFTMDPSFGFNQGTNYQVVTTQTISTSCGTPTTKQQGFNDITVPTSVNNEACTRLAYQFPIGQLNGTIIDKVQLQFDVSSIQNPNSCTINEIDNQPSLASANTLWNDIGDGPSFISNSAICQSLVNGTIIDLGSNGVNALQNRINNAVTNNWFAIGIKSNDETRGGGSDHVSTFGVNSFRLFVSYHIATPSQPLNMIGIGHPHKNSITYTIPISKGSSPITNYNLYRSTFPFAKISLPVGKGMDPENYIQKMNMINNTFYENFDSNLYPYNVIQDLSGNKINATFPYSLLINSTFTQLAPFTQVGTTVTIGAGMAHISSSLVDPDMLYAPLTSPTSNKWNATYEVKFNSGQSTQFHFPFILTNGTGNAQVSTNQESFMVAAEGVNSFPKCIVIQSWKDRNNAYTQSGSSVQVNCNQWYYYATYSDGTGTIKTAIYSDPNRTIKIGTDSDTPPIAVTKNHTYFHLEADDLAINPVQDTYVDNLILNTGGNIYTSIPIHKGLIGNALYVDGSTSWFNTTSSLLPKGNDNFLISVWLNKNATTPFIALGFNQTSSCSTIFQINATYMSIQKCNSFILQNPITWNIHNWSYFSFIRNATGFITMINNTQTGLTVINNTSIGTPLNNAYEFGVYTNKASKIFNGLVDEFSIFKPELNKNNILNLYMRGNSTLASIKYVGNVTSIDDTGLGNGLGFFYRTQAVNSVGNGTLSNVVNATTSTIPNPPIAVFATIMSSNRIDISCTPPLSNGGDPIQSYQVKRNGTVIINSTSSLCTNFTDQPVNVGDTQTYSVCAWNGVGCSAFTSTSTNSSISTSGTVKLVTGKVGDVISLNATTKILTGSPSPVILKMLKLYVNGTSFQNVTLNQNIAVGNNFTYGTFWYQFKSNSNSTFRIQAVVTNFTGNILQNNIGINSISDSEKRIFPPNYFVATDPTQGSVNYTTSRSIDQKDAILKINRDKNGTTFQIECLYQTAGQIAITNSVPSGGVWDNRSNVGYYIGSQHNTGNIYVTCYNSGQLFTTTIYSNATLLQGIAFFDNISTGFIGVPVGVFAVLLFSGLATGRTAPTITVIVLAVVAIMAGIGFFTIQQNVWGICLIAAACGLFAGKKFL